MSAHEPHREAANFVRDAGGRLVGRTRLQKVAYLAHLAGFSDEFEFEYRHYGPYSEDLASAMEIASALGIVNEEERASDWGSMYSIYSLPNGVPVGQNDARARFVSAAAEIDPIEIELAATAAFLYTKEGIGRLNDGDPWEETKRRKPEKAAGDRLDQAKRAYRTLLAIETPNQLPPIV